MARWWVVASSRAFVDILIEIRVRDRRIQVFWVFVRTARSKVGEGRSVASRAASLEIVEGVAACWNHPSAHSIASGPHVVLHLVVRCNGRDSQAVVAVTSSSR